MGQNKETPQFVLCVRNEGCDDLELRKVYQVLPDATAAPQIDFDAGVAGVNSHGVMGGLEKCLYYVYTTLEGVLFKFIP